MACFRHDRVRRPRAPPAFPEPAVPGRRCALSHRSSPRADRAAPSQAHSVRLHGPRHRHARPVASTAERLVPGAPDRHGERCFRDPVPRGLYLFSLLAGFSALALARRFSPHPLYAALLFCATPAFVINGTSLESDIPFVALW